MRKIALRKALAKFIYITLTVALTIFMLTGCKVSDVAYIAQQILESIDDVAESQGTLSQGTLSQNIERGDEARDAGVADDAATDKAILENSAPTNAKSDNIISEVDNSKTDGSKTDGSKTDDCKTDSIDQLDSKYKKSKTVEFTTSTIDKDEFGEYKHNFVTISRKEADYEGYRVAGDDFDPSGLFVIYPFITGENDGSIAGAFYNVTPILGMHAIDIICDSDKGFVLLYGNDRNNLEHKKIVLAEDFNGGRLIFDEDASFFRIETYGSELYVTSLGIHYTGEGEDATKADYFEGARIVPETDYNPKEGKTLTIPYKVTISKDDGSSLNVTKWKSYTYHSYEYCYDQIVNKGANPKDYAIVDPVDIANYYVLFDRIPPNFGVKVQNGNEGETIIQGDTPSLDEVNSLFGRRFARRVSEYSYSGGYAESVPYREYTPGSNRPLYYEFDYDVDGTYTTGNRGIGRVVGWEGGFTTNNDYVNAVTLTDDHYYTFLEYTNYGQWNERFDGDSSARTGKSFDMQNNEKVLEIVGQ